MTTQEAILRSEVMLYNPLTPTVIEIKPIFNDVRMSGVINGDRQTGIIEMTGR